MKIMHFLYYCITNNCGKFVSDLSISKHTKIAMWKHSNCCGSMHLFKQIFCLSVDLSGPSRSPDKYIQSWYIWSKSWNLAKLDTMCPKGVQGLVWVRIPSGQPTLSPRTKCRQYILVISTFTSTTASPGDNKQPLNVLVPLLSYI